MSKRNISGDNSNLEPKRYKLAIDEYKTATAAITASPTLPTLVHHDARMVCTGAHACHHCMYARLPLTHRSSTQIKPGQPRTSLTLTLLWARLYRSPLHRARLTHLLRPISQYRVVVHVARALASTVARSIATTSRASTSPQSAAWLAVVASSACPALSTMRHSVA
jgi:hypothetical protein